MMVTISSLPIQKSPFNLKVNGLFNRSNIVSERYYLVVTHSAWIIPGTQKKILNTKLMRKSFPNPNFKNTASGGKKIQIIILIN